MKNNNNIGKKDQGSALNAGADWCRIEHHRGRRKGGAFSQALSRVMGLGTSRWEGDTASREKLECGGQFL